MNKKPNPQRDDVRRMYSAGHSMKEIVAAIGVPQGSISAMVKDLPRRKGLPPTPPIPEAATEFDVDEYTDWLTSRKP